MVKKTRKSLIHLKSSVSGKIPTAEQLNYGEIAINYAKDSEAIFFKNSENNVVEVKTNSAVVEELNTKQDKTDNALATTAKTVTGAINEINTKVSNIPTVNDPKVSIKMNGAEKGSFTLNQASAGEVDLGTVLTEHQSLKTINGETITGSGDISVKGDTVKCRIDQSTMVSGGDGTQENPYVFKMSLEDVKKYKDCDFVEIYDSSSNTSVYSFYRTMTGIFYTPFIPDVHSGCLAGAFIGDELSTAEQIGFAFYSLHISDEVESGGTALVSSRAVYYALQAKQDKLTSGTNIKTINNQSILGSGNVDISAPIYVVPMIMSTDGYPIPDSSKIDTNKLSIYMKSGYTVIGKPVDSSAPIVSFITGNNGYHYHYFDEKKGMMVIRVYGNNLSQHEIEYNYQFAAPQDSGSTGVCGGVPVPTYDDKEKMLKGDGTWSEVKTIDGESLIGSGDIKIKNNDYYLPVSAFSGQTAVTQDVLDAIVDVRNSQGRKHLYIYDETTAVGAVAEASVANWFGTYEYFVSWMAYYGDGYNTIWAYEIIGRSKGITDVSFMVNKFKGATTHGSGHEGIVPAPTTADTESFLCGNGKWEKISGGSSAFNVGTFVLDPNNYKFSELVDAVFANKIIMLKDFLFFSHAYSVIAAPMDGDGSIVTTVAETKDVYCAFIYIGATQGGQVTQVTAIKFTGDNTWTAVPNSAGQLLCTNDYKVDTSMSDTSTNPVQNKVIKAYIEGLVGNVAAQLAQI